jgi:hypothetical protein
LQNGCYPAMCIPLCGIFNIYNQSCHILKTEGLDPFFLTFPQLFMKNVKSTMSLLV